MKSIPIYRGWKRVILSSLEKNYTPDWLQTFNFMQFCPRTNFNINPVFVRPFQFSLWSRVSSI
jgi:hypothetical protein